MIQQGPAPPLIEASTPHILCTPVHTHTATACTLTTSRTTVVSSLPPATSLFWSAHSVGCLWRERHGVFEGVSRPGLPGPLQHTAYQLQQTPQVHGTSINVKKKTLSCSGIRIIIVHMFLYYCTIIVGFIVWCMNHFINSYQHNCSMSLCSAKSEAIIVVAILFCMFLFLFI